MYFVTFATVCWIDFFTRQAYKNILIESIKFCQINKGLDLNAWCLMTNHLHFIGSVRAGFLMQGILRDMKKFTSKMIIDAISNNPQESRKEWMMAIFKNAGNYNNNNKDYQFWQQNNRPIELWSNEVIQQKLTYIHNDPMAMGLVDEPWHWKYSSTIDYAGCQGLLDLKMI